jgi:hypothetical protein
MSSFLCSLADALCPERKQDIATLLETNLELIGENLELKATVEFLKKENNRLTREVWYLKCCLDETEHDYSGSPCHDWKE